MACLNPTLGNFGSGVRREVGVLQVRYDESATSLRTMYPFRKHVFQEHPIWCYAYVIALFVSILATSPMKYGLFRKKNSWKVKITKVLTQLFYYQITWRYVGGGGCLTHFPISAVSLS